MSPTRTNLPLGAEPPRGEEADALHVVWVSRAASTFLGGVCGEALPRLRARGASVWCACGEEGAEGLGAAGGTHLRAPLGGEGSLDPARFAVAWLLLTAACVERRAAIIHSFDGSTHLLAALAGWAAGVPVRLASLDEASGAPWGSARLGELRDEALGRLLTAGFAPCAERRAALEGRPIRVEVQVVPSAARLLEAYGHLLERAGA